MDAGAEAPFDRNRSITSGHAAAAAAAADLAMAHSSMRAFTESFPPGPQHLLSQVPWYLQLQARDEATPAASGCDCPRTRHRMSSSTVTASPATALWLVAAVLHGGGRPRSAEDLAAGPTV